MSEVKKQDPKDVAKGCAILIVLAIIIVFVFRSCVGCGDDNNSNATQMTRQQRVEKLFSAWDGSQPSVEKWVKSQLNDPNSYEHIETTYRDFDSVISINTEFTAKNGFGGRVRSRCIAVIDTLGNLKEAELIQ